MNEELDMVMEMTSERMEKAIAHLDKELASVRAGKASPRMLDQVVVEYYGSPTPLSQVANVNTPDSRTIAIQPWEKNLIPDIERAIINSNLGMNPENNGEIIRLNVPALTEERRKSLVKEVYAHGEHSKINLRNARKEANDSIKKMQKGGDISEDLEKDYLEKIQELVNNFSKQIDELVKVKEGEILTV